MTTDSQQQIAREAADEIHDGGIRCRSALNQIILSAIERAREVKPLPRDWNKDLPVITHLSTQPQRSLYSDGIEDGSQPKQPCEHVYSRAINQPYPRHCIKCDEIEGVEPQRSEQYDLNRIVPVTEIEKLQRSEQPATAGLRQEWAVKEQDNTFAIFEGDKQISDWCFSATMLQAICNAHNAAVSGSIRKGTK